jgi:DNA invertase Pin-like site-specific DNA recombinase
MKKHAVAYVRVSTKKQNIDRQVEELTEYAELIDLKLVKIFKDTVSGFKSDINERTGFKSLKKFMLDETNNVKNLLVHEVSRLGRKNFEVQNTIEEFYQHKINIHFKDLKLSTLNENGVKSPESSIIISILGSMAENEDRLLKDRIKSSLLSSAIKGLAFNPKITGYKKGEDKKPTIDEDEAPIVRRMFELAANKTSLYYISKELKLEFNREFNSKTISGIIKNPFYKGQRMYLGKTIPVDKIVENELWQTANNFLKSRKVFTKRYRVNENIVEGKIECYTCEKPMYQIVSKESSRCNIFKCSGNCKVSVNRPWLYEMIRYVIDKHSEKLKTQEYKSELTKKIKENLAYIKDLAERIIKIEAEQIKNYKNFNKGIVKEGIYIKTNNDYEKELKNLVLALNESNIKNESYQLAKKSKPKHFSDDLNTYKLQIQDILEKVEVEDKSITININNTINYTIPQINPTKLGWIKKKNQGKKMIFENPFDTGIKIKNFITDDEIDSMVNNEIQDNEKEIEAYFNSDEYKEKMKDVPSLGGNKLKKI